jgi:hypothetical protein
MPNEVERILLILGVPLLCAALGAAVFVPFYSIAFQRLENDVSTLEAIYFAGLALQIVAMLGLSAGLAFLLRQPITDGLIMAGVWIFVLGVPALGIMSFWNKCATGTSFPFPGAGLCS